MMSIYSKGIRLLYLQRLLEVETDENHSITMNEIISRLNSYGIPAERKTIYQDIEILREIGVDIEGKRAGKSFYYSIKSREFALSEVKLLVDAVRGSKFITREKSRELINKLKKFTSKYEGIKLEQEESRNTYIKSDNEEIFDNVEQIHRAIKENHNIQFQYFDWTKDKKKVLRHDSAIYNVSPYITIWKNEHYYMVGYDVKSNMRKNYRIDRMINLGIKNESRSGKELFEHFSTEKFSSETYGMFSGEIEEVCIGFNNKFVNVAIDQFGKDIMMFPNGDDFFTINVKVAISEQFFGWIFALGDGAKIIGPDRVVEQMKRSLCRNYQQY